MKKKSIALTLLAFSLFVSGCGKKDIIVHERASEAMLDFYLECLEAEKNGETVEIMVDGVNRYNTLGFSNVSGMSIADEAEEARMTMEQYRETFKIPENMPDDTFMEVAYNLQPTKDVAAAYEMTYEGLKQMYNFPEYIVRESGEKIPVTEDLPWGVVCDELTIENLNMDLDALRKAYGFGEEVTLKTKWKEIRPDIEKKQAEKRNENKMKEEVK